MSSFPVVTLSCLFVFLSLDSFSRRSLLFYSMKGLVHPSKGVMDAPVGALYRSLLYLSLKSFFYPYVVQTAYEP